MSTYYTPGDYWGTVTKQAMGKTKTDKPQFVLSFTVLGQVDPQDETTYTPADAQYERTMFRVITDKTVKYACEDIEQIGLEISSWSQLDPSSLNHVSAVGTSHKFRCNHETWEGNVNEKWSLARGGEGLTVTPLDDKSMRQLDAMFGKSLKQTTKPAPKPAARPAIVEAANSAMQEAATAGADDIPF